MKCEKFYVGFDVPIRIGPIKFPRTLGKFRYGETEYGIGIIPLGGYVKMLGQDDDPRKQEEEAKRIRVEGETDDEDAAPEFDPRSFPAKPVWQRMIIISAGVVMNVITGVIFAAIAFGYGVSYSPAIVGGVMPGGPAWQAGIEPGGKVVSVGTFSDENMHFREMKIEILTVGLDQPDAPIDIDIKYDDGNRNFKLRSQSRPDVEDARMIGLAIPNSTTLVQRDLRFSADRRRSSAHQAGRRRVDRRVRWHPDQFQVNRAGDTVLSPSLFQSRKDDPAATPSQRWQRARRRSAASKREVDRTCGSRSVPSWRWSITGPVKKPACRLAM